MLKEQQEQPICNHEGCLNLGARSGKSVDGYQLYAKFCNYHRHVSYNKRFNYRSHKKNVCEKCGFIPEHTAQLDVDHIDGNKKNSNISNLQTLCANCHRLKTILAKDHLNIK